MCGYFVLYQDSSQLTSPNSRCPKHRWCGVPVWQIAEAEPKKGLKNERNGKKRTAGPNRNNGLGGQRGREAFLDRERVGEGKRGEIGGGRINKKKK